MVDAESPSEQRLRAAGADKRNLHRGRYDPPDIEAAGEGSVNLAKQALREVGGGVHGRQARCRALLPGAVAVVRARPLLVQSCKACANEGLVQSLEWLDQCEASLATDGSLTTTHLNNSEHAERS